MKYGYEQTTGRPRVINNQLEVIPENGGKTCQFKILDPNWRAGVGT